MISSESAGEPLFEELLTFRLGTAEYGVPIIKVKELRAWEPVTRIPFARAWELGLINMRGAVVPVFDLRLRIGLSHASCTRHTAIVVFRLEQDGREYLQGGVVDELTDVLQVSVEHIQTPSPGPSAHNVEFASGLVKWEGRLLVILDLDKAFV